MMKGAQAAFQRQATAFRTFANIYAPYYRQIDATYQLSLPSGASRRRTSRAPPSTDVIAAFEYYLKHYNHGRPFILAGALAGLGGARTCCRRT